VVIGGIYTQTDNDHETRVPLLGDIPVLGALFRSQSKVRDKTELLIFLTRASSPRRARIEPRGPGYGNFPRWRGKER
jgi:Flp pilus assembly secretin CpaC